MGLRVEQALDLVRQAEAGEEVVLTRNGRPAARIVPVPTAVNGAGRARLVERLRAADGRRVRFFDLRPELLTRLTTAIAARRAS